MYTIPSKVMHNTRLSATAKLIYSVIFLHCDDKGFSAITKNDIAEAVNCTIETVNKGVIALMLEGFLNVTYDYDMESIYEIL